MRKHLHRRAASSIAVVAATCALAGCFSVESNITVNDDGTADIELVTLIDTEQLSELGELFGEDTTGLGDLDGQSLLDELTQGENPCSDLTGDLADYETEVEEINQGSEVGVRCTVRNVPLAELTDIGADSSLRIEQDDDGTRFEATLEGVDELTGGAEGLDLGAIPGFDIDELFSITFSVTGPGSLGDNNATSTSGSTATWSITADAPFVTNGDAVMSAEWTPGGGGSGSSTWIIIAVILGVVALALLAFLLLRRRGSGPAAGADEAAVMAPPTGAVTAPPAAPTHPPTSAGVAAPASAPPPPPSSAPPPPPSSAPPPPPPSAPPPPPPA